MPRSSLLTPRRLSLGHTGCVNRVEHRRWVCHRHDEPLRTDGHLGWYTAACGLDPALSTDSADRLSLLCFLPFRNIVYRESHHIRLG
jgi:hypothetical protein